MQQLLAQQAQLLQQQVALLQAMSGAAATGLATVSPVVTSLPAPIAASSKPAAPAGVDSSAAKAFGPFKDLDRSAEAALHPRQREYLDALIDRYTKRTAGSKAHTQKYRQWYADPRTASGFNWLWKEMVY